MRHTVLFALVAALLLAPAAHAQSIEDIQRDCEDDSVLEGDYPASALRDALESLSTNLVEYSDCGDVLSREIAARTAVTKTEDDVGAAAGPPRRRAPDSNPSPTPAAEPRRTGRDPGVVTGPSTPQDWQAIDGAMERGADAVPVNGRPVSRVASVGRNGIPGSVVVVLALLGAAALAMLRPPMTFRRRPD